MLKDELEPKHGLADKLYAAEILSDKDMENIKDEPSRNRRADIFIKSLVHISKSKIFGLTSKIMNAFKDEKLEHLLSPGELTSGIYDFPQYQFCIFILKVLYLIQCIVV